VIYFVKPRGRRVIKIGYAQCVGSRVKSLQTAGPDKLEVLAVVPGDQAQEQALHARFAHLRVRGEWFRLAEEVRLFLNTEGEEYKPHLHDPVADRELIGLSETARLLSVSRKTVQRMLAAGELPGVRRVGQRTLISLAVLEQWVERGCPQVAPAPGSRRRNGD
jgi:excisionase family DNA binding protein